MVRLTLTIPDAAPVSLEKTSELFFTCPHCGKKYHTLYAIDGEFKCSTCEALFYDGKNIPSEAWKREDVDAIRCDRCQSLILCSTVNVSRTDSYGILFCWHCNEGSDPSYIAHRAIAIEYETEWYAPQSFLEFSGREGITEAENMRDQITARLLNFEARIEYHPFKSISELAHVRVYWKRGIAIGYYTYILPPDRRHPTLGQIFVRKKERRNGHGIQLMSNFLNSFEGKLAIDNPNLLTLNLLKKMGEVIDDGKEFKTTGRLGFLPPSI